MPLKKKLIAGFVAPLVLLSVISVTVYLSLERLLTANAWVNHTYEAIELGNEITTSLINMETGLRGFLVAGKEVFLEPYDLGKADFSRLILAAKAKVADNARQVARLEEIEVIQSKWHQEHVTPAINYRRSVVAGTAASRNFAVISARTVGNEYFDEFRVVLADIQREFRARNDIQGLKLINNILIDMLNQETGQRGFLLSGKETSLAPYREGIRSFQVHHQLLENWILSRYNPGVLNRFKNLTKITEDWRRSAVEPEIQARREMNKVTTTLNDVVLFIEKEIGKQHMDHMRQILNRFIKTEKALIEIRNQEQVSIAAMAEVINVGGTVIALFIIALITFGITRMVFKQLGADPALLKKITEHIADGNFSMKIDKNATGILKSMESMRKKLASVMELKQLALYDSLTGLSNRYLFLNRLDKALLQAKREKNQIAVFFFDIDHFKKINDTLGHDQGDHLLCSIATVLKKCTRPSDTVARMGGDEFTILIPLIKHTAELVTLATKFLYQIQSPIKLDGREVIISASIGIAIGDQHTENANVLMKNADLAMYRAKSTGRNNYQFFSSEMSQALQLKIDTENELRSAIAKDEFLLYFQPQVSVGTEDTVGFEALIRWDHPEKGIIHPADFISIAEETELILTIGEFVIDKACAAIRKFTDRNLLHYNGRISVNISAKQFRSKNLLNHIQASIKKYNIRPDQLELEITESLLMQNIENSIQILRGLNKLGIISTIDDFGTGYSSLNYLKRLPIQVIKIDQTFLKDIPNDKNDMEITSAIIAMAHKLGLKVIAEGVENESQVVFLKLNQCDFIQGYLYGEPLPFLEEDAFSKNTHEAPLVVPAKTLLA